MVVEPSLSKPPSGGGRQIPCLVLPLSTVPTPPAYCLRIDHVVASIVMMEVVVLMVVEPACSPTIFGAEMPEKIFGFARGFVAQDGEVRVLPDRQSDGVTFIGRRKRFQLMVHTHTVIVMLVRRRRVYGIILELFGVVDLLAAGRDYFRRRKIIGDILFGMHFVFGGQRWSTAKPNRPRVARGSILFRHPVMRRRLIMMRRSTVAVDCGIYVLVRRKGSTMIANCWVMDAYVRAVCSRSLLHWRILQAAGACSRRLHKNLLGTTGIMVLHGRIVAVLRRRKMIQCVF